MQTRLTKALDELREDYRIKRDTDFAITCKYGKVHLLCHTCFEESVIAVLTRHGILLATVSCYD
jgi:hypothetical protein